MLNPDPAPVNWPFPTWKGQPLPLKMEFVTMNTQHTPGPWEFEKCPTYGHIITGSLPGEDSLEVVARVCHPDNARLVAAAPELLEALLRLTNIMVAHADILDCDAAIDAATAAIAKTTQEPFPCPPAT